jgi:predicted phosphate transport protein (TIGR00153 family)
VRLIPRDERFFDMFAEIALRITRSVMLLHDLFRSPDRRAEFEAAIKAVEHEADELVHQVNIRIDTSFVTPLDREDIHLLATRLDNVIDLIDGTARRAAMFNITDTRDHALRLTDVLVRAAKCIEESVRDIRKPQSVSEYGRKIKGLEEEGDQIYHEAVGALFAGDNGRPDPLEVIKWKELFDKLEEAIDECEDVSNVLESISLKNS